MDAIKEAPELITAKTNIAGILRGHRRRNHQAAAALRSTLSNDVPDRTILWEKDRYRIEEATDPRHLQRDSAELRHCVGTAHNSAALTANGLEPDDPEAIENLHYWMKIKDGTARIFTLTRDSVPVVTIEYDPKAHAILQMENSADCIDGREPYFPALCRALYAMKTSLGLKRIDGLPEVADNAILTKHGAEVRASPANYHEAIAGSIVLERNADPALIAGATGTALITADISALDEQHLRHIPQHVLATLRTSQPKLMLEHVVSGDIIAHRAESIFLPRHQEGRVVTTATRLTLPMHRTGDVLAASALEVSLPLHETGDVIVSSAEKIHLPMHQFGDVGATIGQGGPLASARKRHRQRRLGRGGLPADASKRRGLCHLCKEALPADAPAR